MATKEVRKTQIDRYSSQQQNDVDLLDALAKLCFAFMSAEHNRIKFKFERKQRLRHKGRQICGE